MSFTANDVLYGEERELGAGVGAAGDAHHTGVDAILCGSDQMARGVSDTLRLIGCRVPEDITLVGFGHWSPMALGAAPPSD